MTTQLRSDNEENNHSEPPESPDVAFTSEDVTLRISSEGLRNPELLAARRMYDQLLAVDSLALYLNGEKQPILIRRQSKTILGRYKAVQDANVVDLSPYYAHLLGVSREHAAISFNGCWLLEDLNSSNGTWINESMLEPNQPEPLENGDIIRLGHFQIIVSY
jgi:hypothetical protein